MRHRSSKRHLGSHPAHQRALLSELASSLVLHESIETTVARARALRSYAEKLVTLAKSDSVASRRKAARALSRKAAVKKLFEVIGPKYRERHGGYLRIRKTNQRAGDSAKEAIIAFV